MIKQSFSIMDKRKNNGGHPNSGRKPKADELKLIERLDAIIDSDEAIKTLGNLVLKGDMRAVQLYMGYRYGKPKESVDINSSEGISIDFKELIKFK